MLKNCTICIVSLWSYTIQVCKSLTGVDKSTDFPLLVVPYPLPLKISIDAKNLTLPNPHYNVLLLFVNIDLDIPSNFQKKPKKNRL